MLHERIDSVLALVGVILRAFVALFEREAWIAVGKTLLLRRGERNVGTGEPAQFSGRKIFGADIPA